MGKDAVSHGPLPLYVCVHVPEFPAQALLRLRPHLAKVPVAVLAGNPPLESVTSVNAQAQHLGVEKGMTKAELGCFDGLTLLKQSEAEERRARAVLLEAASSFTPRIELQKTSPSSFAMVLDMTGGERLFGEPPLMLASLLQALSALQFFVHLAASANLLAAVCLAPYARRKPVLIARGNEAEALAGLPVAALPLSAQQAETFSLWGLQTLGQVAALPEVDLIVRLGQSGKRLRLLARGEHPHLMRPEEPVFALEELVVFDQPLELLDSLLFVVGPMLDQLLIRAQNHALALASVTLKLGLEGGAEPGEQRPAHVRSIKPALPAVDRDALLKLLHLDLLAHPPAAGIVQVELQAEPGVRGKVQIGLFAPQLPESTRLDVTLARIEALVGEERVGKATLLDIYRPDSFRMERFVVAPEKLKEVPGPPRQALALRRCRPPKAVSVWQKTSGLHCFAYNGTRYTVHEMYGPWRRSGSWWTPEVWSHEEWDVCATAAGGETMLCLLAHDLLRHAWRLEGLYD